MSEGFEEKIDARLGVVKGEFDKLEQEKAQITERRTALVNQVSAADRRINEINVAQIDLNARYNELLDFLPRDKKANYINAIEQAKPKPKETTVKNKKKK